MNLGLCITISHQIGQKFALNSDKKCDNAINCRLTATICTNYARTSQFVNSVHSLCNVFGNNDRDYTVYGFVFFADCCVAFDSDEICIVSGKQLSIICNALSSPVTTSIRSSSMMSFSFQLQTGEIVTCESSPCQCDIVNETALQLTCDYLPASYINANLSCYLQDSPSMSLWAPVHVRGNVCSGLTLFFKLNIDDAHLTAFF